MAVFFCNTSLLLHENVLVELGRCMLPTAKGLLSNVLCQLFLLLLLPILCPQYYVSL